MLFSLSLSPETLKAYLLLHGRTLTLTTLNKLTWTSLPQGFRDSPNLFGQALASDLSTLSLPGSSTLIEYVDDLLPCSPDHNTSLAKTIAPLTHLAL